MPTMPTLILGCATTLSSHIVLRAGQVEGTGSPISCVLDR